MQQGFADLLRHYRHERGLSLREFEAKVGMSQANLSRLEHGRVGPPARSVIDRLEKALEVPEGHLLRAAGLAVEAHAPADVESAIAEDTDLLPSDKAILSGMLRIMRERRREDSDDREPPADEPSPDKGRAERS